MKKKKPPLRSELINRALLKNRRASLRSEDIGCYTDTFVDPNIIGVLQGNADQIIYGRRGTGKTHVLGALHESCLDPESHNGKVLSFHYFAHKFLVSPELLPDLPIYKSKAYAYFKNFVKELSRDLLVKVDEIFRTPKLISIFNVRGSRKRSKIETQILELADITERGECFGFQAGTWTEERRVRTGKTEKKRTSFGAKAEMGVSPIPVEMEVQAGVLYGRDKLSAVLSERMQRREGEKILAVQSIRKKILEIIDVLELDHVQIIIDEWMSLDDTARMGIQPEFAELLKRCFFSSPRLAVKIGTDRYRTQLNMKDAEGGFRGLELEEDIFPVVDLDWAILKDSELREFYRKLLFKRLCFFEPEIKQFEDPENPCRPLDAFITGIFENEGAFVESVRACEGIPRDFLNTLNAAFARIGHDVRKQRIGIRLVQDCTISRSVMAKQKKIQPTTDGELLLFCCIKQVVQSSNSRLVLVSRKMEESLLRLRNGLKELLSMKLISEYPEVYVPSDVRQDCGAYLVEYGTYLDWQRAIEYYSGKRKETLDQDEIVPRIGPKEKLAKCVLSERTLEEVFKETA